MRSHVMEVLDARDLERELHGELKGTIRLYPRALPRYMLRILRKRFTSVEQVLGEIDAYALVVAYLGSEHVAVSTEFIVEYTGTGAAEIVLCGMQEYVNGALFDPWGLVETKPLESFYRSRFPGEQAVSVFVPGGLESVASFVHRTREMVTEAGCIPDLAGNGNLLMTHSGNLKLVDINNILQVGEDEAIPLDSKGYPSCDKSIEVLWILENRVLKTANATRDPLYRHFLSAERVEKVRRIEKTFFENISCGNDAYPPKEGAHYPVERSNN